MTAVNMEKKMAAIKMKKRNLQYFKTNKIGNKIIMRKYKIQNWRISQYREKLTKMSGLTLWFALLQDKTRVKPEMLKIINSDKIETENYHENKGKKNKEKWEHWLYKRLQQKRRIW